MAATSNHPGDIFNWILKVIDSCEKVNQLNTARNLVYCFDRNNNMKAFSGNIFYSDLVKKLDDKFFELTEKNLAGDK